MNARLFCVMLMTAPCCFLSFSAERNRLERAEVKPGVFVINTNGEEIPASFSEKELWPGAWKTNSSGIRVQVYSFPGTDPKEEWLSVSVGSTIVNSEGRYMGSPSIDFSKFELFDSDGNIVPPLTLLQGSLPAKIQISDLPRYANGSLKKRLDFLTNSPPAILRELRIQDVYRIRKTGDYNLNVCVVIYKFETNRTSLTREDLPCLSVKIHLDQHD